MGLLKILRKNKILNSVLRKTLKKSAELSVKLHNYLISRWRPSGVLDCNFGEYKFNYYNECDDGLADIFYYNLPYNEKADLNLFIELSKKSKTIVDIGANTGLFSVLASIVNPKAEIIAFEPYRANAERMKINLNLNAANNITVHQIAIGENDGEIEITVPKDKSITDVSSVNNSFSKMMYPNILWDKQNVSIKKLDTFVKENNIHINLIKCDVETFEMSVFKGAEKVLAEQKPTIIFECFLDDERKTFFNNLLTKHNYYTYLILEKGVVYSAEGFRDYSLGLNYLITPVKPTKTFISYSSGSDELGKQLLLHFE